MPDDEKTTGAAVGTLLVSYVLGELDTFSRERLEKKVDSDPALRDELEEVRTHVSLHQNVRKVAPRRGSFERLRSRMKKDGAFDGAIPGVHCMLRRSFVIALLVGAAAIALLAVFSAPAVELAPPDEIGEIIFTTPGVTFGQSRDVEERMRLEIRDEPYNSGSYDAYLWLPTGVSRTYSSIETGQNTSFRFSRTREATLLSGNFRHMQIQPGGVGDGPFILNTPHGKIQIDEGSLSVSVTPDGAETRVSVGSGAARVWGLNGERGIPVTAGYCTAIERGKVPAVARPVLKLSLAPSGNSLTKIEATLRNDGYSPIVISRAINLTLPNRPIYLMRVTHTSEYVPGSLVEGETLWTEGVTPEGQPEDHTGTQRLAPGESYRFVFNLSSIINTLPRVTAWVQLEYRGDLYGPPGEARVVIASNNLKLDLRNR